MAGERPDGTPAPERGRLADELAAAGFVEAVEVGRGGAGVVYRCYQSSLGRRVAVKVLASDLDKDNRERFLREGYAMGKLSGHPNIVNILQVGVTESNRPYIVMPFQTGGSLAQRIHRVGRIAWPDALRIGVKLCGALETAHRAGTLHRDIKPGNVLINDYGEPQLSDFGIARIVGGYETATGYFTGTIAYTAPDVLTGNPPTTASDVYSLGATIYALIAGTAAYDRHTGEDLIAQYLRVSSTPVPDMRPEGIPADVCAAIEKAMSLDPANRHASAEAFGHELQFAQRHNGLIPDSMALSEANGEPAEEPAQPVSTAEMPFTGSMRGTHESRATSGLARRTTGPTPPTPPPRTPPPGQSRAPWPIPRRSDMPTSITRPKRNLRPLLFAAAAAVVAVLLVVGGVFSVSTFTKRDTGEGTARASQPTAEKQADWQPITNARVAREAVATTEVDGTIWIFGGLGGGQPRQRTTRGL